MIICFCQPPQPQRTGGLDAAIQTMQDALRRQGADVRFDDEAETADIVHFHGLWRPEHARLARHCARRAVPYVVSPHGMLEPWAWRHKWWKKWPYFAFVEGRFLANANGLLATSSMEATRLRRFFPNQKIETIPLGLTGDARPNYQAARKQLGWVDDEQVLLYLSRIHRKKGLDLLLRALTSIEPGRRLRLVVVGPAEPAFLTELNAYCSRHRERLPRIDWLGEVWGDERWKYFQGADLFCLPSRSENFGLAVLEACQVGTPVLTTDCTPWASELQNRGFIAKPDVGGVRNALGRFFSREKQTPDERKMLSAWTWKHFHWDVLAPRYVEFYRGLMAG